MRHLLNLCGRVVSGVFVGTLLTLMLMGCDEQTIETSANSEPKTATTTQQEVTRQADTGQASDWTSTVANRLDKEYPQPIMGMANNDTDAVVNYVARYPADDHLVYVTHGASALRFPHEFVMRVRFDTHAGNLDQRAPTWPDLVLAELAEVESRTRRLFTPGDFLENMKLDGVDPPYRHFVFYKDPKLEPLEGPGPQPLFFLQVIPLNDAQLARFKATPEGATSELMQQWSKRDPLFLVNPASEAAD